MSRRLVVFALFALVACVVPRARAQDELIGKYRASEWVEILKTHKEVKFRRGAIIALEVAGPKVKNVLDALLDALAKDSEEQLRREAALCLGRMGADAKGAVDALGEALKKDKSPVVREAAARALAGGLNVQAESQVLILAGALKDAHEGTRIAAADALKNLGEKAKPALDKIGDVAKDPKADRFTRLYCVQLVAKWSDPLAGPPILLQVAKEADAAAGIREAALEGLGRLAPEHMETAPILSAALTDKNVDIRRAAATALSQMGDKANSAWAAVKKGLEDSDAQVRHQLFRAAANVAKEQKEAVPLLVTAAKKDAATENRLAAILELGDLGKTAADALPELSKLASDEPRPQLREAAQNSVAKIKAATN